MVKYTEEGGQRRMIDGGDERRIEEGDGRRAEGEMGGGWREQQ